MNALRGRVDQAPLGAPLGHHPARRRGAHRRPQRARRVGQHTPTSTSTPTSSPARTATPWPTGSTSSTSRHRRHHRHGARHVARAGARPRPSDGGPDRRHRASRPTRGPTRRRHQLKDGTKPGSSYVSVLLTGSTACGCSPTSPTMSRAAPAPATGGFGSRARGDRSPATSPPTARRWQKIATMTPKVRPGDRGDRLLRVSSAPAHLRRPRHGRLLGRRAAGQRRRHLRGRAADARRRTPAWQSTTVKMPVTSTTTRLNAERAASRGPGQHGRHREPAAPTRSSAGARSARRRPDDDVVEVALIGVIAGLMALISRRRPVRDVGVPARA